MKMRRLTHKVNLKSHGKMQLSRETKFTLTYPFEFELESQPTHFHRHFGAQVLYY